MNVYKMKNAIVIEDMTDKDFQKLKEIDEGTFNKNILPRPEMTLDEAIKHAEKKSGCNNACAMEHIQLAQWLKELKILREKILPRPVIRDGNGKLIKDHTPRDFYLKLSGRNF